MLIAELGQREERLSAQAEALEQAQLALEQGQSGLKQGQMEYRGVCLALEDVRQQLGAAQGQQRAAMLQREQCLLR